MNLANFKLHDMTECGISLRNSVAKAATMETAANGFVNYLYDNLTIEETGEKACVMVRFYRTLPYSKLEEDGRDFARKVLGAEPETPDIKCLVLLATAGILPEWNERKKSNNHRAIPLPSENAVRQAPMIVQLIQQFGIDVSQLLKPDPELMIDLGKKTFNVFYVPKAEGSPSIPAQDDFVKPYKVESVLGFGGILSDGDLFAIILFSKVPIPEEVADMFKTIALNVKLALLPLVGQKIFDS